MLAGDLARAHAQSRQRIVRRWLLLLPGVLATLGSTADFSYPYPRNLLDLQIVTAGVIGFLIGSARGAFMGMESD